MVPAATEGRIRGHWRRGRGIEKRGLERLGSLFSGPSWSMMSNRTTVVAIHGVGHHPVGAIRGQLASALSDPSIDVREFNWDRLITHPYRSNLADFLVGTAADFANTASVGFEGSLGDRFFGRRVLTFHNDCFVGAQVLLAAAFVTLLMLPVMFVVGPILATLATDLEWRYFAGIVPRMTLWLRSLATLAAALLILELLVAFASGVRAVLMTLRRVVLLPIYQLIQVATGFLSIDVSGILPMGTFLALVWVPAAMLHFKGGASLHGRLGAWVYPLGALAFLLTMVVFGLLLGIAARFWKSPFKVALDIVRYVGNPSYRKGIQHELKAQIDEIPGGERRIVLAAHSLGSIIAIDALVNFHCFSPADSVMLVTAGSPLARSFFRFFPSIFFPASVEAVDDAIRQRIASFVWVNVYRPFDYVGARVGLTRRGVGVDLSSKQWTRLLSSHSDYWSDLVILRAVGKALRAPAVRRPTTVDDRFYVGDVQFAGPYRRELSTFVKRLSSAIAIVIVVGNFGLFVHAKRQQDADLNQREALVERAGVVTTARVTHWQDSHSEDELAVRHHYRFEFSAADGRPVIVEIKTDTTILFDRSQRRMDADSLQTFIRAGCEYTEGKPGWLLSKLAYPCQRGGIRVKHLAEDPFFFMVADFPSRTPSRGPMRDWLTGGWYLLWGSLFSFTAVRYLGVPLLESLLGLSGADSVRQTS
jgi:hypothetical protein